MTELHIVETLIETTAVYYSVMLFYYECGGVGLSPRSK